MIGKSVRKQEEAKKGFDLNVHVRNGKGEIIEENHYILRIEGDKREFERPPGSGLIYDEAGTLLRKEKGEAKAKVQVKPEFDQETLLAKIAKLEKENLILKGQDEPEDELEEIYMTVDDITMDDVPLVPASKTDNFDELRLMQKSGGTLKGLGPIGPVKE